MSPNIAQYIGFIVLVIIMSGLAVELNRRIEKRRMAEETKRNSAWMQLDVHKDIPDEPSPESMTSESVVNEPGDERTDENDDRNFHLRAKQNGHYSESKKPG